MLQEKTKKEIGQVMEQIAADYLQKQGLKLIAQNYFCKVGEIDLIMQDKNCLVFIEVRARAEDDYGDGLASITRNKQNKIIRAAKFYLQECDLYDKVSCRFDIISARLHADPIEMIWIKDAFWVKY